MPICSDRQLEVLREVYQYHRQRAFAARRKLQVHKKAAEDLKEILDVLEGQIDGIPDN